MSTMHPQVPVDCGGFKVEVDRELAPLIPELWAAGCETFLSCQEHVQTGKVWVAFYDVEGAKRFLDIVAVHDKRRGSMWHRMNDWYFGNLGASHIGRFGESGDWEYHCGITDEAHDDKRARWR